MLQDKSSRTSLLSKFRSLRLSSILIFVAILLVVGLTIWHWPVSDKLSSQEMEVSPKVLGS